MSIEMKRKWAAREPKNCREITEKHLAFNPNDLSKKNSSISAGVVWRSTTKHDKYLEEFYKTHHYLGFGKGGWVPNDEGEEE